MLMTSVKNAFSRYEVVCKISDSHHEFTLNLSRNSLNNQAFVEKAVDYSFFWNFEYEY